MINAANNRLEPSKDNESIVPFILPPKTTLTAKQQAAECSSEYEESVRLLVLSNKKDIGKDIGKATVSNEKAISHFLASEAAAKDSVEQSKSPRRKLKRRTRREGERRDLTGSSIYKHKTSGLEFKINNKETQGAYTDILDSAISQMLICFDKFGERLMAMRVDLHMSDPEQDNKIISRLLKSLNKKVRRRFPRHKNIGYVWVAETGSKSKKKHYHLHLYLNGNCVRTSMLILPMITASWQALKPGNTVAPASYYRYITSAEQLNGAVETMSYLAKSKDKGFQAKGANDYSTSRLVA